MPKMVSLNHYCFWNLANMAILFLTLPVFAILWGLVTSLLRVVDKLFSLSDARTDEFLVKRPTGEHVRSSMDEPSLSKDRS